MERDLLPNAGDLVTFECLPRFWVRHGKEGPGVVSALFTRLNKLLLTLTSLKTLRTALQDPELTPKWDKINTALLSTLASLPSLEHLSLRLCRTTQVDTLVELISTSNLRSLSLEWLWYEGPSVEDFEKVKRVAAAKGVRFGAARFFSYPQLEVGPALLSLSFCLSGFKLLIPSCLFQMHR